MAHGECEGRAVGDGGRIVKSIIREKSCTGEGAALLCVQNGHRISKESGGYREVSA